MPRRGVKFSGELAGGARQWGVVEVEGARALDGDGDAVVGRRATASGEVGDGGGVGVEAEGGGEVRGGVGPVEGEAFREFAADGEGGVVEPGGMVDALALGVGAVGGWAVCSYVLDTDFAVIWPNALAIVGLGILANILAGLAFSLGALNAAPAQVLRNQD